MQIDKTAKLGGASGASGIGSGSEINSSENRPGKVSGGEGPNFGDLLTGKISGQPAAPNLKPSSTTEGLRFSQHALERMANRGIAFKPEDMARLNDAVDKAAKKGSRESLVLMGDNAFIVSVKNKTVVTAMDREAMKENVFTNIDSTVII